MTQKLNRNQIKLNRLESALYAAGRPLSYEEIKPVLRTKSERTVSRHVKKLMNLYDSRNCALEIKILEDGRVSLQINEKYENIVKQFSHKPLLKRGPLKTLSYVAFHQPVDQRQIIAERGTHVYSHLRMLDDMGLITRERTEDRSYIVETTSFFSDYFGFSNNPIKSKIELQKIFRELKITKLDDGSIDEKDLFDEEFLADAGDRLPQRLSEYTSTTNRSS
jgi:segregation and condensation protein B